MGDPLSERSLPSLLTVHHHDVSLAMGEYERDGRLVDVDKERLLLTDTGLIHQVGCPLPEDAGLFSRKGVREI